MFFWQKSFRSKFVCVFAPKFLISMNLNDWNNEICASRNNSFSLKIEKVEFYFSSKVSLLTKFQIFADISSNVSNRRPKSHRFLYHKIHVKQFINFLISNFFIL